MKKFISMSTKILVSLLFIALLFTIGVFVYHKVQLSAEYQYMLDNGYINKYSAGEYDLNIYRIGNQDSKHKLIGLAGLGVNNFAQEMEHVNKHLVDDYEIIYIDRAGYGYSDDTDKPQTVEQIVSDYRTALKSAGIEAPYILMPHSLGGVYATYWESMYPDEIEAVVFIDGSEVCEDMWSEDDECTIELTDYIELFASKIGLHRFVLGKYFYPLPSDYSEEAQRVSDYLNIYSATNKAKLSEIEFMSINGMKTYDSIKSNDVPKLYINASSGWRTTEEVKNHFTWLRQRQIECGLEAGPDPSEVSEQQLQGMINMGMAWEQEKVQPYIQSMGNTELVLLAGDHMIFEHRPDDLAEIIKGFLLELDK